MRQGDALIFEKQTAAVTEIVPVRLLERRFCQEDFLKGVLYARSERMTSLYI